jgi:hypothetical protein
MGLPPLLGYRGPVVSPCVTRRNRPWGQAWGGVGPTTGSPWSHRAQKPLHPGGRPFANLVLFGGSSHRPPGAARAPRLSFPANPPGCSMQTAPTESKPQIILNTMLPPLRRRLLLPPRLVLLTLICLTCRPPIRRDGGGIHISVLDPHLMLPPLLLIVVLSCLVAQPPSLLMPYHPAA